MALQPLHPERMASQALLHPQRVAHQSPLPCALVLPLPLPCALVLPLPLPCALVLPLLLPGQLARHPSPHTGSLW